MSGIELCETGFDGLYIIKLSSFKDHRGVYTKLFSEKEFYHILNEKHIVDINYQKTILSGTVRGLHYQIGDSSEVKIIKCIHGRIFDVAVDVREGSETFLQYFSIELSQDDDIMVLIPEGFAHGFQTLEDNTETLYATTQVYDPASERGLNAADPSLSITWPLEISCISEKDRMRALIKEGRLND